MKSKPKTFPVQAFIIVLALITMTAFMPMPFAQSVQAASRPGKVKLKKVYSKIRNNNITGTITWKKTKRAKKYEVYIKKPAWSKWKKVSRAVCEEYKDRSNYQYANQGGYYLRNKKTRYVKVKTTKAKKFTIKNLDSGKSYKVKVRAVRGKKKGGFSKVKNIKTPSVKYPLRITAGEYEFMGAEESKGWNISKCVKIYPLNAKNKTVTAKSSNENILRVENGKIIAGGTEGYAKITFTTANGKTCTKKIFAEGRESSEEGKDSSSEPDTKSESGKTKPDKETGKNVDKSNIEIPDISLDYKGEDGNRNVKIKMYQKWTDTVKNSLGTCDMKVERKYDTVYVYDSNAYHRDTGTYSDGDFSNYLEVHVGKKKYEFDCVARDYDTAGLITGWTTNQNEIANWKGHVIRRGDSYSETINNIRSQGNREYGPKAKPDDDMLPFLSLYRSFQAQEKKVAFHPYYYFPQNCRTDKIQWGSILMNSGYVGGVKNEDEEIMAENYTNMIRAAYGSSFPVLKHSEAIYRATAGPKDAANDWAAYGDIEYTDEKGEKHAHMLSGSVKPELKGKSAYERDQLVHASEPSVSVGTENGWTTGSLGEGIGADGIVLCYNSDAGHRNAILTNLYISNGTRQENALAIGITMTNNFGAGCYSAGIDENIN